MKYILTIALAMVWGGVLACDICGCAASGNALGLLPGSPQHFIGLGYKYRTFETTHLTLFADEIAERSHESYQTYEVWGRYVIHPRIQLLGYLPYQTLVQTGDSKADIRGMGDIQLTGLYNLPIWKDSSCTRVDKRLLAGATLKLPTGEDQLKDESGELYHANLQPGTGSYDVIYHLQFTAISSKWGALVESSLRLNGHNSDHYRFGHRFQSGARLFRRIAIENSNTVLLPFVGGQFEHAGLDFDGTAYNNYSGGNIANASLGIDAIINHVGLRTAYQLPVWQELGGNQIQSNGQWAANIYYLF